jgi:hypothetical protein
MNVIKQRYNNVTNDFLKVTDRQAKIILVKLGGFINGYISNNSDVKDNVQSSLVNAMEEYVIEANNNNR